MSASATSLQGVSFQAAPGWAEADSSAEPATHRPELTAGGLSIWLVDDFVDLLGPDRVHFSRQVKQIVAPDGLQRAASFEVDFDPTYQRLVIHHIRVLRGGAVIELARPDRFEVLRRERDLERAHYDGRLAAHMILPDLRVGDIVDVCFSVIGANPALKGWLVASPQFQWGQPVARCRYRVFAPPSRKLAFKSWGQAPAYARTALNKGNVLHSWTADGFSPIQYEDHTPPWWIGHAMVVIADVMTWRQVAELFQASYAPPATLPTELEAHLHAIRSGHAAEGDRIAACLKLLQSDVRYLAISVGEGGFTPRSVDEIWRTRFGDCKDKSRLLSALLKRLGVDAAPALVNTTIGRALDEWPPGVAVFDHCVVRVKSGGAVYWLDPTRAVQGGRLERLAQVRFGWALALVPDAELQWMGEDAPETVYEQHEHVVFGPARRASAEVSIRCTHRGWRADEFRRRLANEGLPAMARAFRTYYESHYGLVDPTGELSVDDREPDNEIRTTESYLLKEPWRLTDDGGKVWFSTVDETFRTQIATPEGLARTMPFHLGTPRRVIQNVVLDLPRAWSVRTWTDRWELGGVTAEEARDLSNAGRRLSIKSMLEVKARVLPPDLAPLFKQNMERSLRAAGVTLTHGLRNGEFAAGRKRGVRSWVLANWWRVIWLALVALYLLRLALGH